MINSKVKRQFSGIRRGACAALAGLLVLCAGCGREPSNTGRPEDVELVNPVGISINYETVTRRDLYNTKVYSGVVCPHVEEYHLEESTPFMAYDAFPGSEVRRGDKLLHGNTESYDDRIENMEETIANMDESYQEFVEENTEARQAPLEQQKVYGDAVKNMEAVEPERYLVETDPETGEEITTENPAYAEWSAEYKRYDGMFRSANQALYELDQALKERTELYELDRAYNLLQMQRLKDDRQKSILTSDMDGVVASMQFYYQRDWLVGGEPLVAVGDMSRKEIRCEYVAKNVVDKAEDVYAIIDGKRYEVEYVPMEAEEYSQLMDRNDYVYGTFRLIDDADEVEIGSYVVIVVKSKSSQNVLAVPNDAVNREGYTNYVYVIEDGTSVYTTVTTGMTDGVYTEIVSGIKEGDRVLTEHDIPEATETVKVEYGEMHNTYTTMGYLYYPATELVRNPVEYGTCYYVESCVSLYQRVQKGEVLGRIRVVPDQLEIDRNERKLQRERERLADLIKQGTETHEKEIAAKEKVIKELEELVADMKADAAITEIKAPADGIISGEPNSGWPPMKEGSLLSPGEVLFVLADENKSYLYIEDSDHRLTYGNVAEITYTGGAAIYYGDELQISDKDKESSVYGKVVTLNHMSLNSELVTDYSLILVGAEDMGKLMGASQNAEGRWMREFYGVTVNFREMENVLVVPKRAVTLTAGATYVKVKLENGDVEYRSFVAGGSDSTNYWVVEGLTEGMEICIE